MSCQLLAIPDLNQVSGEMFELRFAFPAVVVSEAAVVVVIVSVIA